MSNQMDAFWALLAIFAGKSPIPVEFPTKRTVTRSFDVFFDLRLNKQLKNIREAGDLIIHRAQYEVTVLWKQKLRKLSRGFLKIPLTQIR